MTIPITESVNINLGRNLRSFTLSASATPSSPALMDATMLSASLWRLSGGQKVISISIFSSPLGAFNLASSANAQQAVRYSFFFLDFLAQCKVEFGDNSLGGQGKTTTFFMVIFLSYWFHSFSHYNRCYSEKMQQVNKYGYDLLTYVILSCKLQSD